MTLAELIADSKDRIAEGSSEFFKDTTWRRWLNEAQRYVVRRTKVLERSTEITVVQGQQQYTLDASVWTLHFVRLSNDRLQPASINDIQRWFSSTEGKPSHYALWDNRLYLYPTPSHGGQLTILYYAWPVDMVQDTDTPEIPEAFHGLLPTFAAYRAKMADQQTAEAQSLFLEFQQGLDELVASYTDVQDQVSRVRDVTGDGLWL